MHQEEVIAQLLVWIEHNLDQPLRLDDIAAKAGYSKWHLQRLFKQLTGHILGSYTRRRRLTAAAHELRLTRASVIYIADKYQFDSQQSFTRCFKKQFGEPPATYRRNGNWATAGMQPALHVTVRSQCVDPECERPSMIPAVVRQAVTGMQTNAIN